LVVSEPHEEEHGMHARRIIALTAGAALLALPVAADAKANGHRFYRSGWEAAAKLAPATGQKAQGRAFLRQHDGALTLALRVAGLKPWTPYGASIIAGSCATPGTAQAVTIPTLIGGDAGNARLWITLPTAPGADFAEKGFAISVADGSGAVVSCGDIAEHVANGAARIKGLATGSKIRGGVTLRQTGTKVADRVSLAGLTPNATYGTSVRAGTCAAIGATVATLQNVIADARGRVGILQTTDPVATDVVAPGTVLVVTDATAAPVACGVITGRFGPHAWADDSSPWWWRWWF
jgi:hypothetical protein